jgi:hypothetical protein
MKKLLILSLLILMAVRLEAATVSLPKTYGTNDTVTASNLNGNNNAILGAVNGGLDNENADTANGFRFQEVKGSLPTAGSQGRTVFLTTDNTLNFDTGSTYAQAITLATTGVQGDIMYHNGSAWTVLNAGTANLVLKTNGAAANPSYGLPNDLELTSQAQGTIAYFDGSNWVILAVGTDGEVLQTQGAGANPQWFDVTLSAIEDYGANSSSSTSRSQSDLKIAYGTVSVSGSSSKSITNLPFASTAAYSFTVSFGSNQSASEACEGVKSSGSAATIYNNDNLTQNINWFAIGI